MSADDDKLPKLPPLPGAVRAAVRGRPFAPKATIIRPSGKVARERFQELMLANVEELARRALELSRSRNKVVAIKAVEICLAYALGRPPQAVALGIGVQGARAGKLPTLPELSVEEAKAIKTLADAHRTRAAANDDDDESDGGDE